MNPTFVRICELIGRGEIYVSEHRYDELANDDLFIQDILAGVVDAVIIEDYPDYHRGPHACWCFRKTRRVIPFMSFGEYRKAPPAQPFW